MPAAAATGPAWDAVVERLERDPGDWLNLAQECCARWAADDARLALTIVHGSGEREAYTYAELDALAQRAAALLTSLGLKRGDQVGAVLGRGVEAWVMALGAWRAGLVYVPLFVGFGSAAIAQRLGAIAIDALVFDADARDAVTGALALMDAAPASVLVVPGRGAGGALRDGERSFWDELPPQPDGAPLVHTAADELAVISFTSGTTSVPKGCAQPHGGLLSLMAWFDHAPALDEGDVLFTTADPGWTYGLFSTGLTAMSRGLPRVIYTGDFDPDAWLDLIEREQITHVATVPTALRKVVEAAGRRGVPACLRGVSSAGEALDAPTGEAWSATTSAPIRDIWGMSELGLVIGNLVGDEIVPGALASTVPGWEVRLLDADGATIEGEGQGTIVVRRPPFQLSTNYVNAPDLWDARWIDGEWFDTGDVARRDDVGRIHFVGRDDDVIVTAGYNVGPAEVEAVIQAHDAVAEVAVVGAPDPKRGGLAVRAVVVLADGAAVSEELVRELQQLVREGVGRHAYPRIVDFVDALPKTETGKVRRAVLRAQSAA